MSSTSLFPSLRGQHVLITGAAGGIGLKCAETFLRDDCHVSLHYNSQKETLKALEQQYPNQVNILSVDARSESAIVDSFKQATEKFGLVHIAVINHAVFSRQDKPIWDMSLEQWNMIIDVDLTSYFLYAREWTRQLKKYAADIRSHDERKATNASIVFIGSTAGVFGEANHIDYASAKGALQSGFILSLKNELVQLLPHARANIVAPGWVATPMAKEAIAEGKHLKALNTMPLKKVATPDDIAASVYYYAHPQLSGHITGSVQVVAGGMEGRTQGQQH